jgi:hypothetical protein
MPEGNIAAADNSASTAQDQLINEVLGVEASPAEGKQASQAPEQQPEKPKEADANASQKPEGQEPANGSQKPSEGTEKQVEQAGQSETTERPKASRIDKRIATLAVKNAALAGQELDYEEAMSIVGARTLKEKKQILKELWQQNAQFRGLYSRELSEEDLEALAEMRAEEKLAEREMAEAEAAEVSKQDGWHETLTSLITGNPALDEKSTEYNPVLAEALELMLSENGSPRYGVDPKAAWEKVQKAAGLAEAKAKAEEERGRQEALSGALSGTGQRAPEGYTWEEVNRIQAEDPELYLRLVRENKLPA